MTEEEKKALSISLAGKKVSGMVGKSENYLIQNSNMDFQLN
jgi:hypothetical protein